MRATGKPRGIQTWRVFVLIAPVLIFTLPPHRANAATEIRWWHAMTDANRRAIEELTLEFNAAQKEYIITPAAKGSYADTMAAGLKAFEDGDPPHILQVVEVGTATMMSAHGMIKPVHEVMRGASQYFDPKGYLPAITGYYSTANGEMLSFPFNSSSAVMWLNVDALAKAGLDRAPLDTWPQVFSAAKMLQATTHPTCGFSSAWITWIMIEQFSAWHNVPIATKVNGIDGLDTQLRINSPLHIKHIGNLAELQRTRIFDYSGRNDEGENRFVSGECAILLTSSGFYGKANAQAQFNFRTKTMPYYPDVAGAPQNSLIGGASLWVMRGKTPHEYRGIAKFFAFLSETDRQAALHQKLGYLPVTRAAYEKTKASNFYHNNPFHEVPLISLTGKPPTEHSRGVRLGDMVGLRNIWAEEIEAALRGKKTPASALEDAFVRGNSVLRDFEEGAK